MCHAPHFHPCSNEEQTSERSDDVSPLSNDRLCAGTCEKNSRTFAHSVGLSNKIALSSLVYLCVHWRLYLERHQMTTDVHPEGICGGTLFAPPFTSARVQSRFEFVELGRDMYSNYQGEVPAGTGITGCYQGGTSSYHALHMNECM